MNDQINEEQQMKDWVREQFQRANQHLAENGILFESVVTEESRYLAPAIAVWKIKDRSNKFYWVLSGDLPVDFLSAEAAPNAREAVKRFSYAWQMKAANILAQEELIDEQSQFADLLEKRAQSLYHLADNDQLWQNANESA